MNKNSSEKINILFIIDVLKGIGGTENHLYYLTKYLRKERFNCFIVAFDVNKKFVKRFIKEGIKFYHIPVARYYTPNALVRAFELKKIIKENNIDIVQTFHFKSDTYGVVVSKISGVRNILSSRRDSGFLKNKIQILLNKIINSYVSNIVTVSEAVSEQVIVKEKFPKSKQVTIYNGVDLSRFNLPAAKEILNYKSQLGIGEGDFVVGTVANFRPEKNYDIFFKGLKNARRSIDNLKILAVGFGPLLTFYKDFCSKNGMNDYTLFAGKVRDVRKYISVMDVACLISSTEGFSNSLLEKMAMAKPLVVTGVGGNKEVVIDGENGVIIPPRDYVKLTEAIISFYHSQANRKKMGEKGREIIEKYFSLQKMISNYEKFYEGIVK